MDNDLIKVEHLNEQKTKTPIRKIENPLSDLISDETFELLDMHNLINGLSLRDYKIRKKFRQLRLSNFSVGMAIQEIRKEHPYLQTHTIRKIVQRDTPNSKSA